MQKNQSIGNVFQDYFKYKRENQPLYQSILKRKKIEFHVHYSQIVTYQQMIEYYVQSEYRDNVFFIVRATKGGFIKGMQVVLSDNDSIFGIGINRDKIQIYSTDVIQDKEEIDEKMNEKMNEKEESMPVFYKMKDNKKMFYETFNKYMKNFNEQFLYYRAHSYVFKNLVYGDQKHSSEDFVKKTKTIYIQQIQKYMKDQNIVYMDVRLSSDRLHILEQFAEQAKVTPMRVKFIIQFQRKVFDNFDLKQLQELLDNEYFLKAENYVIGIDFTGQEQKQYNFTSFNTCLTQIVENDMRPFFHNGEEPDNFSLKNCLNTVKLIEQYKEMTTNEYKIPYRIGHGYQLINNNIKIPEYITLEFCPTTLLFSGNLHKINMQYLKQIQQQIVICSDDTQRYDMTLSDCYMLLYFKNYDSQLIEQFFANTDNVISRIFKPSKK